MHGINPPTLKGGHKETRTKPKTKPVRCQRHEIPEGTPQREQNPQRRENTRGSVKSHERASDRPPRNKLPRQSGGLQCEPLPEREKQDRRPAPLWNPTTSFLTATTLIYAIGAGITAAAGTRLALQLFLVEGFKLHSFQLRALVQGPHCYFLSLPPRVGIG